MRTAIPDISEHTANRLYLIGKQLTRNRNAISLIRAYRRGSLDDDLTEYLGICRRLINALTSVGGVRTIVDTSKSGTAIILMSMLDLSELDVIHLVRDPRGVAWSQLSHFHSNVAPELRPPQVALARSMIDWSYINLGIAYARRYCDRYVRLAYEELFESPRAHFQALCKTFNLDDRPLIWSDDSRTVTLPAQHIIAGNPNRFGPRQRLLTVDDGWREKMPAMQRLALGPIAELGRMILRPTRPAS